MAGHYAAEAIQAKRRYEQTGDTENLFELCDAVLGVRDERVLGRLKKAGIIASYPLPMQQRAAVVGTIFKLTPAIQRALGVECPEVERNSYDNESLADFPIIETCGGAK
jgi:hypothetical protein